MAVETKRTGHVHGDRARIANSTLGGRVVVEGFAEIVAWIDEQGGVARVVFDTDRRDGMSPSDIDALAVERRIDHHAQGTRDHVDEFVAGINAANARSPGKTRWGGLGRLPFAVTWPALPSGVPLRF